MEIVTFTGAPVFMENGTFHVPNPGKTAYTGPPSPEIDSAWEEITAGKLLLLFSNGYNLLQLVLLIMI